MRAKILYALVAGSLLAAGTPPAHAADGAALELVRKECSTCHGTRGISVAPTFPHLAAQQAEYLEVQLRAFRDHSRADPHAQAYMWGMAAQLTDPTIKEISKYFSTQPAPVPPQAGAAEIAAGKKIFEEGVPTQSVPPCQSCHMPNAHGNGPFPRLAGQHRQYLEKQLEVFAAGVRANEMMHATAQTLTALQISQLAAFLSSQP
ncbi:MAG TPA: c-type cytochrome [Methylomirabilota bacterium]|nr:c-type cytochrome [Methylomirabilota bacterium]